MTAAQPLHDQEVLVADLFTAIVSRVPRLPGAACREPRARAVFDCTGSRGLGVSPARREAIAVCQSCESLIACRRWIDAMPERERPFGIVAGQLVSPTDIVFVPRRRR